MSSLNDSEEQTSPPVTVGSLGVQVASSHFSKIRASRGNSGCLEMNPESSLWFPIVTFKVHSNETKMLLMIITIILIHFSQMSSTTHFLKSGNFIQFKSNLAS